MANILVVDDELGIRDLLFEILNDEGHNVELAENAAEARAARQRARPDLVLLDIWMPDTDGVTLLKEWSTAGLLTMPVVMMSGHATIDTAVDATRIGAFAFLEKPITMQKLLKASGEENPTVPLFYLPHAGIEDAENDYVREWETKHRRRYEMVDWIEDRIIEAKVKVEKDGHLLKAVFIDHIHQIFPMAKMQNVSLEIGDLVARIKNIAVTHNLAIFLIAHTKDDPQGTAREPRKEDIRDSGLITRLSDSIIGVWRIKNSNDGTKARREEIEETDNKTKVRLFKNRRNGTQGFFTMYHKNHYLTEDFDWDTGMNTDPKPTRPGRGSLGGFSLQEVLRYLRGRGVFQPCVPAHAAAGPRGFRGP